MQGSKHEKGMAGAASLGGRYDMMHASWLELSVCSTESQKLWFTPKSYKAN